jgi:hypothetical protein
MIEDDRRAALAHTVDMQLVTSNIDQPAGHGEGCRIASGGNRLVGRADAGKPDKQNQQPKRSTADPTKRP